MTEWIECILSDIGEIVGGATPSTKDDSNYDGDIAWLTPKDLSTFTERYIKKGERSITEKGYKSCSTKILPANSVLFSSRAPIGYVAIAANEMCTNQGFKSIIPNEKVDYMFLYYLLKYKKSAIEGMGSGTTFKEVSGNVMKNIEVRIPKEKSIQKKIAEILDKIDSKIENNNMINRNLSEQVFSIYRSWFIDFERNSGECPNDWTWATLGDIAEIASGKRPPMKQDDKSDEANIPLVGAASIMGYTNSVLYNTKILVTGRVGTHGVIQRFNEKCWPSDNTLVITTERYEFVNQILMSIDYNSMNRGSTQPLITQGDLKKTEIILPSSEVLDEFETLAGALMAQYEQNRLENTKLAELRDSLLPKLMSGELDVSVLDI